MIEDLYQLASDAWEVPRKAAKTMMLEAMVFDNMSYLLDDMPSDWRAELLRRWNIIVGEN